VARKEIGLEVNAEKTKYMVMSRDQNAGRNYSMKNDNKSFEREEQLKYFGTNILDQNSIQIVVRKCLLSFDAASFVFQCAIQKYKN
jgi:hypothetical protein